MVNLSDKKFYYDFIKLRLLTIKQKQEKTLTPEKIHKNFD